MHRLKKISLINAIKKIHRIFLDISHTKKANAREVIVSNNFSVKAALDKTGCF